MPHGITDPVAKEHERILVKLCYRKKKRAQSVFSKIDEENDQTSGQLLLFMPIVNFLSRTSY